MVKEAQPQPRDYALDGIGRYVVMHVLTFNGWYRAKDLSKLLGGLVPVSYASETSLVQFYWPRPDQIVGYDPTAIDELFNQAIGEFMVRCDRIEFRQDELKAATGVTIAPIQSFDLGDDSEFHAVTFGPKAKRCLISPATLAQPVASAVLLVPLEDDAPKVDSGNHPSTLPRGSQSHYYTNAGDISFKVDPEGAVTITGGKEVIWNGNPCLKTPASSDG